MRRIVLLVIVASLVAITSVLWADIYKAAQVVGDLTTRAPVTIAASAVSMSVSSLTPLPYPIGPYISERHHTAGYLSPQPLVRSEFS